MSSETQFDIAQGATVDLRTTTPAAYVGVGSPAVIDGVTLASLSAEGLLEYRPDLCSGIVLANGSTINAIRPLYTDGTPQAPEEYEDSSEGGARQMRLVILRSEDGGSFTLAHDVAPPVSEWELEERLTCQYGRDVVMANAYAYVQWERASTAAGSRRWRVADWGAYLASDAADWDGAPPTSVWGALDRLAGRAPLTKYEGVTDGSGDYTVVYAEAYAATPSVLVQLTSGDATHVAVLSSSSTTGFTVAVSTRDSVNVDGTDLLTTTMSAVVGASLTVWIMP